MKDVAGLDTHILRKALAFAIEAIERLPKHRQEGSDQAKMKLTLDYLCGNDENIRDQHIQDVRRHFVEGWDGD